MLIYNEKSTLWGKQIEQGTQIGLRNSQRRSNVGRTIEKSLSIRKMMRSIIFKARTATGTSAPTSGIPSHTLSFPCMIIFAFKTSKNAVLITSQPLNACLSLAFCGVQAKTNSSSLAKWLLLLS